MTFLCLPLDQVKGPSELTLCSFSLHIVITDLSVSPTKPWLPGWLSGKESDCKAGAIGDMGLIPGSGRSSGGGHGNPFQYSCLENPVDRGTLWATVYGVAKSWTWLKWLRTHALIQYEFILIISAETFFPIRLHPEVPGRHGFWRDGIQPTTWFIHILLENWKSTRFIFSASK